MPTPTMLRDGDAIHFAHHRKTTPIIAALSVRQRRSPKSSFTSVDPHMPTAVLNRPKSSPHTGPAVCDCNLRNLFMVGSPVRYLW